MDKRTAEEKETDEDIDEYLKEIYKESLLEKAERFLQMQTPVIKSS